MAKSERIKELGKKYEAVSACIGPKGKSGLHVSSVLMKELESLDELYQGHNLPRKLGFEQGRNCFVSE